VPKRPGGSTACGSPAGKLTLTPSSLEHRSERCDAMRYLRQAQKNAVHVASCGVCEGCKGHALSSVRMCKALDSRSAHGSDGTHRATAECQENVPLERRVTRH
jgi:hypothetical protein